MMKRNCWAIIAILLLTAFSVALIIQKKEKERLIPQSVEGDLLIVIDMQNAYKDQGPWTCPNISAAEKNIIALIESGTVNNIVFTQFDAPADPVGTWKKYNEINADVNRDVFLNEIVPSLKEYSEKYPLYHKSTYSSLSIPELEKAVEGCIERGDSVVVTGVVSECCVLATAMDIIDMGCPLIYLKDSCAGSDDEAEASVVKVLKGLDYVQTKIMTTDEYIMSKNTRLPVSSPLAATSPLYQREIINNCLYF